MLTSEGNRKTRASPRSHRVMGCIWSYLEMKPFIHVEYLPGNISINWRLIVFVRDRNTHISVLSSKIKKFLHSSASIFSTHSLHLLVYFYSVFNKTNLLYRCACVPPQSLCSAKQVSDLTISLLPLPALFTNLFFWILSCKSSFHHHVSFSTFVFPENPPNNFLAVFCPHSSWSTCSP